LCDADTTSLTAANLLIFVNNAYEKVIGKILGYDGNWEFDDTNYTDFPRATTTMVAGQHDYTFDTTHLAIESAQVLDADGIWHSLSPIGRDEMGMPEEEFEKTGGLPVYYDKDGASILIYPAPATGSVTMAAGLKVHFRRTASVFTAAQVTTGTKVPGFASPFHEILAYEAAVPFCLNYKKDRLALIEKKLADLYENMEAFYTKRSRDERNVMTAKEINFR
jgi:hypothetical protein